MDLLTNWRPLLVDTHTSILQSEAPAMVKLHGPVMSNGTDADRGSNKGFRSDGGLLAEFDEGVFAAPIVAPRVTRPATISRPTNPTQSHGRLSRRVWVVVAFRLVTRGATPRELR